MATIKIFDLASLESICKILGDTDNGLTSTEITKYLSECNISDPELNSTKWKRLYDALSIKQQNDRCANNVIAFIQHVIRPSRHVNNQKWFEDIRTRTYALTDSKKY